MWSSEQTEKDRFAFEWLREPDAFKAALAITGEGNAGRALLFASEWIKDPYVINKKKELIDEQGEESFLPAKAEIARKILAVHDETLDKETKLKALRLYSEVLGYITKPGEGKDKGAGFTMNLTATDVAL
jgi:hypothetical protein